MKSIVEHINERKYKTEKEVTNIFFDELIKTDLFKNSIGQLPKELQEDFIFVIYYDIINWDFDIPSTGNRIVQRKDIWSKLKVYADGTDLSNMIKEIYKVIQK